MKHNLLFACAVIIILVGCVTDDEIRTRCIGRREVQCIERTGVTAPSDIERCYKQAKKACR